ncbi:hypothetical protein J6590_028443 [Homalodisca vitripennis]|nr:hypothetical protein J6590_028443 [Homalodisca vitripennis]
MSDNKQDPMSVNATGTNSFLHFKLHCSGGHGQCTYSTRLDTYVDGMLICTTSCLCRSLYPLFLTRSADDTEGKNRILAGTLIAASSHGQT